MHLSIATIRYTSYIVKLFCIILIPNLKMDTSMTQEDPSTLSLQDYISQYQGL